MADESQFILLLKSLFDNKGTKEAAAALKEVKKEADATEKSTSESASKTSKSYQEMGMSASLALKAAETMVKIGSAGITALYLNANNYAKQMGMGESTSRQWLKTTYQIKEATIGLGRTAAEAMLPAYQKTAEILTNISDWSNKNPAAAKTMFGASAALVTTGTMIATVNGLKNIFSGLGGLTKL
ncbi:MAG: hypothetical protein M0R06_02705, partial [Sphaerochaeta sp.]|nr:hypothetical protein [Sphaerochaeta sp.]